MSFSQNTGMDDRSRDLASPDGSIRIEFSADEFRMSHWVYSPRIIDTASGKTLFDLWHTAWDAEAEFDQGCEITLYLRRYPGNIEGFVVRIDPEDRTYRFDDMSATSEPLSQLKSRLDKRHREREQAVLDAHSGDDRPSLRDRLHVAGTSAQRIIMMILAIAFAAGGIAWIVTGQEGIAGWVALLMGFSWIVSEVRSSGPRDR